MNDAILEGLRAAVEQSPENLPLRLSLVRLLVAGHRYAEAESECKVGLKLTPADAELKLVLGEAFYAQGKLSAAEVLAEELVAGATVPAGALLLLARCSQQRGDHRQAAEHYRAARQQDGSLADETLDALLRARSRQQPEEPTEQDFQEDPMEGEGGLSEFSHEFTGDDPDGGFVPYVERPRLSFADVGGMESVKEEIRLKIIHPLTHPEIYAAYGKKTGGGILLFGPPGCGKTHLARATAGEVRARFVSVSISDVLDMYTGQSERNLRDIFASARASRPTVLFFDEVDALAASRRDMRQSSSRQVINQFLAELDGVEADNDGVLIMAATNAPWHLDSAFRRPGRFDRILFVPPPDEAARVAILEVLLQGRPAGDVDRAAVARKCVDLSGADLAAVIDQAIEEKLKVAVRTGRPEPLTTKDLIKVGKRIRPSTREWFTMARNHALYANEGGLYDDILAYLGIKK